MDLTTSHDEQALAEQLDRSRARLDGLVADVRAIDAELDGLAPDRHQYRLLDEVCARLDELDAMGRTSAFWGERAANGEGHEHVRRVRGSVEAFQEKLARIEERRREAFEEVEAQQERAWLLEDDLDEARYQEEQRKLEWVVEREVGALSWRQAIMPWARGGEDDRRFQKVLGSSIVASLLLGLILPQIDLPLPEPFEVVDVPERLARLIKEPRRFSPPEAVPQELETPQTEPQPTEEAPAVAEQTTPVPAPEEAVGSKGILAFREKFSGRADSETAARLGSQARITSSGETASGQATRSMVTTQAPGSSGGINLAALSRGIGGGGGGQQMAGVEVARATSSIGGGSGQGRPVSGGPALSRTDEEIQIVFDRHKAALYRLYNRELRKDPTLKGQMVLRLTIEPDGSVSLCEVRSTDMRAPRLSEQVVGRVRTFDFGAKDGIPALTILYPIDFLPAT